MKKFKITIIKIVVAIGIVTLISFFSVQTSEMRFVCIDADDIRQNAVNTMGRDVEREESDIQLDIQLKESEILPAASMPVVTDHSIDDRDDMLGIIEDEAGSTAKQVGSGLAAQSKADQFMEDELWIIEKAETGSTAKPADTPTQGELRVKQGNVEIPLPLKHTAVKAHISGFVASVDVTQEYHNPYDVKIEAVYVFPLPQSAAVSDFVMVIGERRIRGMVREREEAERLYAEARRQGYRAALLTQERPNIFTQKVANIEPGKQIDVKITYFHPLTYYDGDYEFVFPMVVGPRFNPAGSQNGIGALPCGKHGASGQAVEVEYLKPGERSGHDIALQVDIDAGVPVEKVYSRSHMIAYKKQDNANLLVRLKKNDAIPNKDFVLRYRVAGEQLKTAMMVQRGEKENTFALIMHPPAEMRNLPRMPREMVFVLDCSGSMSGWPMDKAKRAMARCLRNLDCDDTFQIIRFSDNSSSFGPRPVPATHEHVEKALDYVSKLHGSGGTMMIEGIKAALDFPHSEGRLRVVSFMTDGYIGNENEILAAIHQRLGAARIFSFGVGNSVNRYLLDRMAWVGKGAVAYLGLNESSSDKVDLFYDRIAHPALTDIEIDWGDMIVTSIYPRKIPDLFIGRPLVVLGKFRGNGRTTVTLKGRCGKEEVHYPLEVDLSAEENRHPAIARIWARWKIKDLSNQQVHVASDELRDEILGTSLEYNVLCKYTAFLAIDSSAKTAGGSGISVNVPVHMPDGVRYETTVVER